HTDFRSIELESSVLLKVSAHEEPLAIKIVRRCEEEAEVDLARHCPGGDARQDVDAARLECFEPLGSVERDVVDLASIVENCRRDRAAEVDVEAAPGAVIVARGETVETLADAAVERSAVFDGLEELRG